MGSSLTIATDCPIVSLWIILIALCLSWKCHPLQALWSDCDAQDSFVPGGSTSLQENSPVQCNRSRMKITFPLSFCSQASPMPSFPSVTFASYIRDRSSQLSCANQLSTCHFRMQVEIWLKKGQDCPCQPLITKSFCTWCNVLQVHSPPSQLLPIRGNLGNMGGNWRALLPACHQRRLLLQVRSSQILHWCWSCCWGLCRCWWGRPPLPVQATTTKSNYALATLEEGGGGKLVMAADELWGNPTQSIIHLPFW